MMMIKPAQAQGTVTDTSSCTLNNWYFGYSMGVFPNNTDACAVVGAAVLWGDLIGDCTSQAGWFSCSGHAANANCSAGVCTCNTGYAPDSAGTSCVLPVCLAHAHPAGSTCTCDTGYKFDAAGTSCISICPIPGLTPLTDPVAIDFDNGNRWHPEGLTTYYQGRLKCVQDGISARGGSSVGTFAYRPTQYQQHLYEIIDRDKKLKTNYVNAHPECQALRDEIMQEMGSQKEPPPGHHLKHMPITATITVKDDYDPQPEINLVSITANEPNVPVSISCSSYTLVDGQSRGEVAFEVPGFPTAAAACAYEKFGLGSSFPNGSYSCASPYNFWWAVCAAVNSCPANSTPAGSTCTCNTDYVPELHGNKLHP
jgi:hypothetical protein